MIEKNRLDQLIEQEATVYYLNKGNNVISQKLNKYCKVNDTLLIYGNVPYGLLNNYYKTKEEAEWVAEQWCERVERFEPEMYENIGDWYTYFFSEPTLKCRGTIGVTLCSIIVTTGYKGYAEIHKSFGERTKENYTKAVEYARKLFRGE